MKPTPLIEITQKDIEFIQKKRVCGSYLAALLYARGITEKEDIDLFLDGTYKDLSDISCLPGCKKIAERLLLAIQKKESIVIYGDYDCDGIGATAIYYLALQSKGCDIHYFIPSRHDDGYGLKIGAIDHLYQDFHPNILLTADCGITSVEEIEYAQKLGMEVLVTDHHQPKEILPNCLITNPALAHSGTPYCAAGVAFTVIRAMFGNKEAYKYIDICALSTIADIVPLIKDNRILVKEGIDVIRKGNCRTGIKMLIQAVGCDRTIITANTIAFKVTPILNAAGRIQTAYDALDLLIKEDPTDLTFLLEKLLMQNAERQQIGKEIYDDALEQLKTYDFSRKIIMLYGQWNKGVVGNICSKLVEKFHLPTILLSDENNILDGSSRSIDGVNIFAMLSEFSGDLIQFGGHAKAAGLSFPKEKYQQLLDKFSHYLQNFPSETFERKVCYDIKLPVKSITYDVFQEINKMEPFGFGNNVPIYYDNSSTLLFEKIGKKGTVIKGKGKGDVTAIYFKGAYLLPMLKNNPFSFLYTIDRNSFNNNISTQCQIKEFFFDTYYLPEENCYEAYFSSYVSPLQSVGNTQNRKGNTLYLCYLQESVEKIQSESAEIPVYTFRTDTFEQKDAIIFCPNNDFPLEYFTTVVFCDFVSDILVERCKKNGLKVIIRTNNRVHQAVHIDLEYLRKIYIFYSKQSFYERFLSFTEYYPQFLENENHSKIDFLCASYILAEIGLLYLQEEGILMVRKQKADPTKSRLYQNIKAKNE